jgi:hypothetical protein
MRFTRLFISAAFLVTAFAWNAEARPKYVGVDGCKCHKSEIADWERSAHAKAFELLSPGKREGKKKKASLNPDNDYSTDAKCLQCHSIGFKEDGGFTDASSTPKLAGVGCEMCHGPGSQHMAVPMSDKEGRKKTMLVPTAETCKKCHTDAISPKFDFAEMSKKVHPVAVAAPAK